MPDSHTRYTDIIGYLLFWIHTVRKTITIFYLHLSWWKDRPRLAIIFSFNLKKIYIGIFAWGRDIWQKNKTKQSFLSQQNEVFCMSRKWRALLPFLPSLIISDMHLATQSGILCLRYSAANILSESLKSTFVTCLCSSWYIVQWGYCYLCLTCHLLWSFSLVK